MVLATIASLFVWVGAASATDGRGAPLNGLWGAGNCDQPAYFIDGDRAWAISDAYGWSVGRVRATPERIIWLPEDRPGWGPAPPATIITDLIYADADEWITAGGDVFIRCDYERFVRLSDEHYDRSDEFCDNPVYPFKSGPGHLSLFLPTGEVWVDTGWASYRWSVRDDPTIAAGASFVSPPSMHAREWIDPDNEWIPIEGWIWYLCQ